MTTASVVLIVRGAREAALAAALDGHPDLTVVRRCADLTEGVAAVEAGHGSVVVLSEQPDLDREIVARLSAAGAVVVGAPATVDAREHLEALGTDEVIPPGGDAVDVAAAVLAALDRGSPLPPVPPVPPDRGRRGAVVAVWGPAGAPGRTTVAVNLAAELAAVGADTLCVDVDTYGGAVSHALGLLDEAPGIAALARASRNGVLDDDVVRRYALEAAPRLRVLGGLGRPERWPELSRAALDPVWPVLRRHAEATVVDCGFSCEEDERLSYDTRAPQRNAATLSALAEADVLIVVGRAEPLGIQRLVHALSSLDDSGAAAGARRLVVVNRVRASVGGRNPAQAVADALRRFSGIPEVWPVPDDPRACDAATIAGRTLRETRPRSPAARALAALALEVRGTIAEAGAARDGRDTASRARAAAT